MLAEANSVPTTFHPLRWKDVEADLLPAVNLIARGDEMNFSQGRHVASAINTRGNGS
jgi:hypothetical protein